MRQINSLEELNVPSNYQGFLHYFLTNISGVKSVSKVILFGSCARGQVKERSDIDLFVLTKDEIAPDEEFYIMDDCPPAYDNEYYIPADIIVKSEDNYNQYKDQFGMVQKQIEREGVDLSQCRKYFNESRYPSARTEAYNTDLASDFLQ